MSTIEDPSWAKILSKQIEKNQSVINDLAIIPAVEDPNKPATDEELDKVMSKIKMP